MQHLPFRDAIRLGRVNKRWWRITENTSLWKDVTLLNTTLSCDLVAIAIDRQTDNQTDRQTERQTDRQTDRQAGRQTDRQADRQTDRQADRQTGIQTDRQAD